MLAIVKDLLGTVGRVSVELVVEVKIVQSVVGHWHHASPLVFLACLLGDGLGIVLCRVLTCLECRPLCAVFAGILKCQPRDEARRIGDKPEDVGTPVCGNDQVGFKARLNRLHDQQRRFIKTGAGEDGRNLPTTGVANLGLTLQVLASLQFNGADP